MNLAATLKLCLAEQAEAANYIQHNGVLPIPPQIRMWVVDQIVEELLIRAEAQRLSESTCQLVNEQ